MLNLTRKTLLRDQWLQFISTIAFTLLLLTLGSHSTHLTFLIFSFLFINTPTLVQYFPLFLECCGRSEGELLVFYPVNLTLPWLAKTCFVNPMWPFSALVRWFLLTSTWRGWSLATSTSSVSQLSMMRVILSHWKLTKPFWPRTPMVSHAASVNPVRYTVKVYFTCICC